MLFLACNIVSVGLFSYLMFNTYKNNRMNTLEQSLQEISMEKSQLLTQTFSHVENETENLAEWAEEYLQDEEKTEMSDEYAFDERGVLYRKVDPSVDYTTFAKENSGVYYPASQEFTKEIEGLVAKTEPLDAVWTRVRKNNPYLLWAAIAMDNGFLRIMPYSSMDYNDSHMQSGDPFYRVGVENNPDNETRWTVPYVDLMGEGWVITCSHPVMDEDKVLGVATLDVSLETLENDFLKDLRLGDTGFVSVIQEDGKVIYHPAVHPGSENLGEQLQIDIIKDTDLSNSYKDALQEVMANKEGIIQYKDGHTIHILSYRTVEALPWKLVAEVEAKEQFLSGFLHDSRFLLVLLFALLMFLFSAWFFYRNYSEPLRSLTGWAGQISMGDYQTKNMDFSYTEIQTLSNAFNEMCEKMQERELYKRQAIQLDKMAHIGQISSSIAHELKTPLSIIKGSVYLLEQYDHEPKAEKQMNTIRECVKDAENVVSDLLDFSKTADNHIDEIDLKKLIEQIIIISRQERNRVNVEVRTRFDRTPFTIYTQKEFLKHVLINIFSNALAAVADGGIIQIDCRTLYPETADNKYTQIRISDDGPGIPKEIREHVFEPFATYSKKDGVGLGLWITKNLVDKMDGTIEMNTKEGKGTELIVTVPDREGEYLQEM